MTLATRFLNDGDFTSIHGAWLEGFGDYAVRLELTEAQLREMIRRRGYSPEASVGVFEGTRLVAFTLNGTGTWSGESAVYDTGTAVIPEFRRRGLGRQMLDYAIPALRDRGFARYVLEVLESNSGAVSLYEQHGFTTSRRLLCFTLEPAAVPPRPAAQGITIRDVRDDWKTFSAFWDVQPSWQNSIESIGRSHALHRTIAAYSGTTCLGYAIVFPETRDLAQIAVALSARYRGIGSQLLRAAAEAIEPGGPMRILNIDGSAAGVLQFFRAAGARDLVAQYEMTRSL